ncbi:MAG: metal-dependent transcriptional regulator [Spirochaetia bacterium]
MPKEKKLTPSLEDYLEAILFLEKKNRVARVKDIAERLEVQMPSVSGAVKTLKNRGMVNYEKNSFISLTEKGMSIAKSVQKKHSILTAFFREVLLYSDSTAQDFACAVEHVIDSDAAERIRNLTLYTVDHGLQKYSESEWMDMLQGSDSPTQQ